ncbi:MAG: hypothetical protein M3169_00320 [Candidatus Eremiobacteraeota bacterium]|nr:hypothetical protein [Candidatus Eremiobacteraeota bacterium]
MRKKIPLAVATLAATAGMLIATLGPSSAANPSPCQVLPASTVQSILGSPVQAHAPPEPVTVGGMTQYSCYYIGPDTNASLQIMDFHSASAAAASPALQRPNNTRYARPGTLADHKNNYVLVVSVRKPSDAGKLRALLSAAMRNI